jgi:DNA-binding response OmpR family regulator
MRVVIAAQSGRLRNGLRAMLDAFLAPKSVDVVDDGPSALEAIQSRHPDLIVLDACLFDTGTIEFVCAAKRQGNGARCIVVADRLARIQPLPDAGADKVLLKGSSAAELRSAVEPPLRSMPG